MNRAVRAGFAQHQDSSPDPAPVNIMDAVALIPATLRPRERLGDSALPKACNQVRRSVIGIPIHDEMHSVSQMTPPDPRRKGGDVSDSVKMRFYYLVNNVLFCNASGTVSVIMAPTTYV